MTAVLAGALVVLGCSATRFALRAGDRATVVGDRYRGVRWRSPARCTAAVVDAALPWAPEAVWAGWLLAVSVAAVGGLAVGGPGLAVVGVVATTVGPVAALAAARGRSVALVETALPDVLDAVARSLRSGVTVRQALAELAPSQPGRLGIDLAVVVGEADGGLALVHALDGWVRRCPTAGVRLTVAALGLSVDAGGAAARAVDGVAATLRANLAVAGEVRAQASQARLSALVIAASPLAFGALAAGTDGRTADFLLRSRFGLACLAGGLALDGLAAWWMHRITAAPA
ncbi:MAG: hypothetical protein JWN67_2391 [Actinomycetia bacterium]|nr:hypothetical protein [Actinomycetes bacterium]